MWRYQGVPGHVVFSTYFDLKILIFTTTLSISAIQFEDISIILDVYFSTIFEEFFPLAKFEYDFILSINSKKHSGG